MEGFAQTISSLKGFVGVAEGFSPAAGAWRHVARRAEALDLHYEGYLRGLSAKFRIILNNIACRVKKTSSPEQPRHADTQEHAAQPQPDAGEDVQPGGEPVAADQ